MKVKNENLSFYGAILYYLGAVNLESKKLRALHPLSWVFILVALPFFMLWAGVSNWPELFKDLKEQTCIW